MCGICGVIDLSGAPVDAGLIRRMVVSLQHRGPDDRGVEVLKNVGLGHARLSIIDLSGAAHQPMSAHLGRLWITFNGEIYNFRELRGELALRHEFRSQSDTEVVLHAYREWGEECVSHFNGIFAFAVWDAKASTLFAARDHLGVKPFYYSCRGEQFVFASEAKALLAFGVPARLAREHLPEFMMHGWLSSENTLFEGIKSLEPGCRLELKAGGSPRITRYFDPAARVREQAFRGWSAAPAAAASEQLSGVLRAAVARQMISDVPVGALCSGGVDSSLVTALALQHSREVTIFNVGLADAPGLSEERFAQAVARHLGVEIVYYHLDRKQFRRELVRNAYHHDFPVYNLNSVPVYAISRVAREHGVKVLLAGEGGDELFGGYDWRYERLFRNVRTRRRWGRLIAGVLSRTTDLAHVVRDDLFLPHFRATTGDLATGFGLSSGYFRRQARFDACLEAYRFVARPEERWALAAMLADTREYLEHLLNREDKSGMQASVECRVPLLDLEVLDLAVNLPYDLKVRHREGKWLLKRVAERHLPREVIYRPKRGFNLPIREYLGLGERIFQGGFWETEFGLPAERIRRHVAQVEGSYWYGFAMVEIWARLFLRGESVESVSDLVEAA